MAAKTARAAESGIHARTPWGWSEGSACVTFEDSVKLAGNFTLNDDVGDGGRSKRIGVMQESRASVSLSELDEVTVMTVWPSVAANPLGRILGRFYAIRFPDIYIFRLGNLIALMFIPVSLVLFFHRLGPLVATRYRVTNHRLIVERGLRNVEESSVGLDQFNEVLVEVQPGQSWYFAGDLVFKKGDTEVFRLEGVSRPEAFRHVCLKTQVAYSGVEAILAQAAS